MPRAPSSSFAFPSPDDPSDPGSPGSPSVPPRSDDDTEESPLAEAEPSNHLAPKLDRYDPVTILNPYWEHLDAEVEALRQGLENTAARGNAARHLDDIELHATPLSGIREVNPDLEKDEAASDGPSFITFTGDPCLATSRSPDHEDVPTPAALSDASKIEPPTPFLHSPIQDPTKDLEAQSQFAAEEDGEGDEKKFCCTCRETNVVEQSVYREAGSPILPQRAESVGSPKFMTSPERLATSAPDGFSAEDLKSSIGETVRFMRYRAFMRWYEGAHGVNWSRASAVVFIFVAGAMIGFAFFSVCALETVPKGLSIFHIVYTVLLCIVYACNCSTAFTIRWAVRVALLCIAWSLILVLIDVTKTTLHPAGGDRGLLPTSIDLSNPLDARPFQRNPTFRHAVVQEIFRQIYKAAEVRHQDTNLRPLFSDVTHQLHLNADIAEAAAQPTHVNAESGTCKSFKAIPLAFWPLEGILVVLSLLHAFLLNKIARYYYLNSPWFLNKWKLRVCSPVKLLVPALGQADKMQYREMLQHRRRDRKLSGPTTMHPYSALDPPELKSNGSDGSSKPTAGKDDFSGRLNVSRGLKVECVTYTDWTFRIKHLFSQLCFCLPWSRMPKAVMLEPERVGCWKYSARRSRFGSDGLKEGARKKRARRGDNASTVMRVTFIGEVDSKGRPDGFGCWKDDTYTYGERLVGYWNKGFPNGPHKSREIGTGSGFMCIRIGWARFTLTDDVLRFGVANVECSVSGKFYRGFPHVKFLYPPVRRHQVLLKRNHLSQDMLQPLEAIPESHNTSSKAAAESPKEEPHAEPAVNGSSQKAEQAEVVPVTPPPTRQSSPLHGSPVKRGKSFGGTMLARDRHSQRHFHSVLFPTGPRGVRCHSDTPRSPTLRSDAPHTPPASMAGPAQALQMLKRGALTVPQQIRATGAAAAGAGAAVLRRLRRRDIEVIARLEQSRRDISWCLAELSPHTPNFGIQPRSEMVITVDHERGLYISGYVLTEAARRSAVVAEGTLTDTALLSRLALPFGDQPAAPPGLLGADSALDAPGTPDAELESGLDSGDDFVSVFSGFTIQTPTPQGGLGPSAPAEVRAWRSPPPSPSRAAMQRHRRPTAQSDMRGGVKKTAPNNRRFLVPSAVHGQSPPDTETVVPPFKRSVSSLKPPEYAVEDASPASTNHNGASEESVGTAGGGALLARLKRARMSLPTWRPVFGPTVQKAPREATADAQSRAGEASFPHTPFYRRPTLDRQVNKQDVSELRVRVVRRELLPRSNKLGSAYHRNASLAPDNANVCQCACHKSLYQPDTLASGLAFAEAKPGMDIPELEADGWSCMDETGSPECLVYIHGYNNSHVESLQILGQMAAFGNYPNHIRLFVFSWPAGSGFWEFFQAQKAAEDARTHRALADFLRALADNGMGSRAQAPPLDLYLRYTASTHNVPQHGSSPFPQELQSHGKQVGSSPK